MSLSTTSSMAIFNGNGTTGPFSFGFKFFSNSDIHIFKTSALGVVTNFIEGQQYSLTGAGSDLGGAVTLSSVLAVGEFLTVHRQLPLVQSTVLPNNGPFFASTHERTFDRLAMMIQQIAEGGLPTPSTFTASVSASTYGTDLAQAISAIGSGNVTLSIDSPITVANNTIVPSNILLTVTRAGSLTISSGKTLTINGPFVAPDTQVFTGTGAVAGLKEPRPEWFGSVGDGTADDSTAITKALASADVVTFGSKTYALANVTVPDNKVIKTAGETTVFKKYANGYIFSLGRHSEIHGGTFDGNASGGKTGQSIVIATGITSPTWSLQGQQFIEGARFYNSEGYHIAYTVANTGFASKLVRCKFLTMPTNAAYPAMVLWPDETTLSGNRSIESSYSMGAIVNANGCDNGYIVNNIVGTNFHGGSSSTNEGIYYPTGTTYPAKKIIVTGNRFATGDNPITIRGSDNIYSANQIAGNVVLGAEATNNIFDQSNRLFSPYTFTYSATAANYVFDNTYTSHTGATYPDGRNVIASGITLGDGTIDGEFTRDGLYVNFRLNITLGSTSSVTGIITLNSPVALLSGTTRTFLGSALADSYTGTVRMVSGAITILANQTRATWNATVPKTWASGDVITINGRYRI